MALFSAGSFSDMRTHQELQFSVSFSSVSQFYSRLCTVFHCACYQTFSNIGFKFLCIYGRLWAVTKNKKESF